MAFENGDIHYPYVIGSLWNGKDVPHEKNDDGKNNLRVFKSRSGHKVIFDDTESKEKITIIDKTEDRKIVIDTEKKNIDIYNKDGEINIYAGKDINVETKANLNIKADKDIKIEAGKNIEIKAGQSIKQKSGTSTKTEAGSTMDIKSSGVNTIKGSLIKLN